MTDIAPPSSSSQYINDFTAQTHDLQQVGTLRTKIVLQPGLGPCHYSSPANGPSGSQGRRHALEAWDTFEGQALLSARKAAAAADDGKTDHYVRHICAPQPAENLC